MPVTLNTLKDYKNKGEAFAVTTAYDATFAYEASRAGIEAILVGDSLGMVLQGHDSTLPVTVADMVYHTHSVARGNQGAFILSDMPFLSYANTEDCLSNARQLMQAGAHMVKVEGGAWLAESVKQLAQQGVPVCVHLGLTPQSVNKLGGYRVQGREEKAAQSMLDEAKTLVEAGADIVLLECVPTHLAQRITEAVDVPVIGIGAGPHTDAQVLVMHDLLGLGQGKRPKFVKNFLQTGGSIQEAFAVYAEAVKARQFPGEEHSFNL